MNSLKSDFCAPCFSGDCGLCRNCCARAMNYIKPSEAPESIQRAHSLKKFMGSRVNEKLETYNKSMNTFAKRTGYADPKDIGFAMKRQWNNGYRYQLIQKPHTKICDNELCKVFYISSDKTKQELNYPKYPLYERRTTEENKLPPHYLCALCVSQ